MGYLIQCFAEGCGETTWANNIVELINEHSTNTGMLRCTACGGFQAYIYKESALQEKGETWPRWIRGVIRIDTGIETYSPYVFLTAEGKDAAVSGIHFNYYKDTRPQGGKLKHGHGPGGAPVLDKKDFFQLIRKLIASGVISNDEIGQLAENG